MSRRLKGRARALHPLALPALSGLLLTFSFPPAGWDFLAWVALVPLFFAVESCLRKREAVLAGLTAGLVFFITSLHWLTHVTTFGWLFLSALEAAFMVLFAWAVFEFRLLPSAWLRILAAALAWTAAEFSRSYIPIFGFGWNLLAYSQSESLGVLQSANVAGAFGLGFLIALVNAALFEAARRPRKIWVPLAVAALFAAVYAHGAFHLARPGPMIGTWRISVLQGNIPQAVKWEAMARGKILEIYTKLTELASFEEPHIIFWPEAAFPGYFGRDFDSDLVRQAASKISTPLLVGGPYYETHQVAYNSAFLVDADGKITQRYDKQYLVPFGEYVPLKALFGFLEPLAYSMGVSDFSAGKEKTVFDLTNGETAFSVLICFEDVFPHLAREFVERGAQFLVVITNDAWFGRSAAPYQHLQASVFRAVENGVPVVRAANTGISAFISNRGQVLARVESEKGDPLFTAGQKTFPLEVQVKPTLYRRGGWLFPYFASALFVIILVMLKTPRAKKGRSRKAAAAAVLAFLFLASGCVRLTGGAGFWHKGADDEAPHAHQAGFDSADFVPGSPPPGNITVGEDV